MILTTTGPLAPLAESWRTEAASLAGLDLLALLWWLARDPPVAVRPLERIDRRRHRPVAAALSRPGSSAGWS